MSQRSQNINRAIVEDFFYDLDILGIVTTLPIYTFLFHVENYFSFLFKINIEKSKEIVYGDKVYFFETYEYYDMLRQFEYSIYVNEIQDKYLLPEAKSVQFIWGIKGWNSSIEKSEYLQQLITSILTIPQIQYAGKISNEKIIRKELLLF